MNTSSTAALLESLNILIGPATFYGDEYFQAVVTLNGKVITNGGLATLKEGLAKPADLPLIPLRVKESNEAVLPSILFKTPCCHDVPVRPISPVPPRPTVRCVACGAAYESDTLMERVNDLDAGESWRLLFEEMGLDLLNATLLGEAVVSAVEQFKSALTKSATRHQLANLQSELNRLLGLDNETVADFKFQLTVGKMNLKEGVAHERGQ